MRRNEEVEMGITDSCELASYFSRVVMFSDSDENKGWSKTTGNRE